MKRRNQNTAWSAVALMMLVACGQSNTNERSGVNEATKTSADAQPRMTVEDVVRGFELADELPEQEVSEADRAAWEKSLVPEEQIRSADAVEGDLEFRLAETNEREIIDLRSNDTAIRNQGSEGTCTAFATVAAMENLVSRFYAEKIDISERHHWTTYADYQVTSSLSKAKAAPIVSEASWPYNGRKPSGSLTKLGIAKLNASKTTKLSLQPVVDSLRKGNPVVIGVGVLSSMMNPKQGGIITGGTARRGAGHALAITGAIIDARVPGGGYFILKNSWGRSWGDNGYGYASFDYCQRTWCSAYETSDASMFADGLAIAKPSAPSEPAQPEVVAKELSASDFKLSGHASQRRGILGFTTYYLSVSASDEVLKQVKSIMYANDDRYVVRNGAAADISPNVENLASPDFRTRAREVESDEVVVTLRNGQKITLEAIRLSL